jgi:oligopeptide transport system substrate-binding protein
VIDGSGILLKKTVLAALVLLLAIVPLCAVACGSNDEEPESSTTSPPSIVPLSTPTPPTDVAEEGFYRNTTYGFSLSYPPEWEAQEDYQGVPSLIILAPNNAGVVQVLIQYISTKMTSEEYAADTIAASQEGLADFEVVSEGAVELGDESGYEYVFTWSESGFPFKARLVSLAHGSRAFGIMAASRKDTFDSLKDVLDGIVYSFRLEEPKPFDVSRKDSLVLFDIGPKTIDPALSREVTSASYVLEIFSGLVTLDRELQVAPEIAEKWETSEDGKTYTFHLRQDAKFHDGKAVKANDFKYSLERACDPATRSKTAATYLDDIVGVKDKLSGKANEISGVKVLDDYTLQVTIDAPKAYFLSKLAHPVAFVVDQNNVKSGEEWWRKPNGTGPFKLKEWKEDELLVLERNDRYYGEMPQLENVAFRLWSGIPMMMYETGELDIASVSLIDIERVLDPANALNKELVTAPESSLSYIGFNVTRPPFDDAKVRQAFCHAVDKDKIIKLVLKNMVKRADGILPPGMPGYNEGLMGLEFDPEKASELIRQSKYVSVSNLPPITFTTSGLGEVSPIDEAIIDMWRQNLGVEVDIRQIDPDTYPYVLKEEKDEIFNMGWVADYPDPQNFLDVLFHTGTDENTGEYSNPEVDTLLEAARGEMDTAARLKLYQKAEQMLVDDAACVPLFFSVNYTLVKPYVKGFVAAPMPIPWLKYISLEPHE